MQAPLETAPAVIEQADTVMIYDIATLVNAVYQLSIEPTKDGRVPKRITKKLYPLLKGMARISYMSDNDEYVDMLFDIMKALHLIKEVKPPVDNMKSRFQAGNKLPMWTECNMAEQTRILLEHWQKNMHWDDSGELAELSMLDADDDGDVSYPGHFESWNWTFTINLLGGRTTLLTHLGDAIPGQWYSVNSLLREIWSVDPLSLRQRRSTLTRKTEEKKARESYGRWYKDNAIYYVSMLSSSLHELGLIDLGYEKSSDEDELHTPKAFRITTLGTQMLAGKRPQTTGPINTMTHATTITNARSLIIQPSFEVLQLQLDLPTIYSVLPFTQVKQISQASQLMLSQTALHRGMATGKTITQIIQILEEHTQKALPQNVLYTLQDWAKLYKETRLSMVMLIEAPSESVTKQIAAQERFQRWNVREIAPCILILDGDASIQEVRNALEKTGVTIHLTGNFPRASRSSSDEYY